MAEEGQVSGQEGGGFLAAMGEASMSLEAAGGSLVSGIAAVLPAFPAARFTDLSLNIMHGHPHPPTFGTPLPSTGPVLSIPIFSTASSVLINGLTAARAGDMGIGAWCGGYFPMYEIFTGSSNVYIENSRASRMIIDFTKHCIFTSRPSPPPSDPPVGNFIGNLITGSPNVQIGGAPIPSLFSIFLGAAFAGLGKLAGKGFRALASVARKAGKRLGKNMKPGFIKCAVLKAEPVNVVTGEVVVEQQDFVLPGRIPLEWNRRYSSQSARRGVCGYGWETPADARLEFEEDGIVCFYDGAPGAAIFPSLPVTDPVLELVNGALLDQTSDALTVKTKAGLIYRFPKQLTQQKELLAESISDLSGNTINFIRDRDGLREIQDSSGRRIEVTSRDGLIQQLLLHHPSEAQTRMLVRYAYDQWDDLTTVFDRLDAPYRFFYSNHCLTQHTDRNGLSFYYQYDQLAVQGRCIRAFGDNGLYDYKFEYSAALSRFTNSLGHTWTIECDADSFPIKEIDPLGGVKVYEYDDVGRTAAVVDPDGNRTEYAYDDRGNVLQLTRPDGTAIITEFDSANNAVKITDPNGATWQQEWNSRRLLTRLVSPLAAESQYEYDNHGQLIRFTNPRGARTALAFDAYGNLTHLTDALGYTTQFSYDVLGNVTMKLDPLVQRTRYTYDLKGRLTQVMLPSGATIACSYDAENNLTLCQDENGAVTRLEYCGLGEIKRRLQPDGHRVEYQYDTEEQLIGVTNQRGEHYGIKRDALGRIIEEIDYWGQGRQYTYTASGYLQQSIDPLGRVIRYQIDPLGRILKKLLPNPANLNVTEEETFSYDANSNLIACENGAIRIGRQFDAEGRLIEERQGEDFVVLNSYDPNGNRISRSTSLQFAGQTCATNVHYRYDGLDQVTAVEIDGHQSIRIRRNALGQVIGELVGSQLQRRFFYNSDGYLTAQHVLNDIRPLFDQSYRYDAAGNLVEKTDSVYGTERFTYDPVHRVIAHLDPLQHLKRYLTDAAGDRLRTRIAEHPEGNGPDQQWSREGEYDGTLYRFNAAGNLIHRSGSAGDTGFTWDANQRLIESNTNGDPTTYKYDPLGRRIAKKTERRLTRFCWDGEALVADMFLSASTGGAEIVEHTREWVYYPRTFEPLALIQDGFCSDRQGSTGSRGTMYLYHNEPNGCPSRLLDHNGAVVWTAQHKASDAVGHLAANQVSNPLRLQGQYHDEETGLDYNRHRYYDAGIGQFVSQDPLGLFAGNNLYSFAPNSWGWLDPLGLSCLTDEQALSQALKVRHARVDPGDIRGARPGPTGVAGHAHGKHGFTDEMIAEVINNADRKFIGLNKNGRAVNIFVRRGDAVITEGEDVTRVITAYGQSGVNKLPGGRVVPGAPVKPEQWANDSSFHEIL